MAAMRRSQALEANRALQEEKPKATEGNRSWLKSKGDADGVILLGGTSVADFRIRYAQSSLRADLTPGHWSRCGVLLAGGVFATVPLDVPDVSAVPSSNGVVRCPLDGIDDPKRFPNVAVIRFAKTHENAVRDIERVSSDRSLIDFPALMLPWLGYVWAATGAANPLSSGIGLPAAAFVETVFAMAGFELTPGLSSASSCPEAIWQSAKWWTDYFESATKERDQAINRVTQAEGAIGVTPAAAPERLGAAIPTIPTGFFILRQRVASVVENA
jgi:hypothetical protein